MPDLNGDGRSDLLWYNPATGQTVAWLMDGINASGSAGLLNDPDWKITASADINGDGMTDLIWTNAASGQTAAWLMNGTSASTWTLLLSQAEWKVIQTADLNGDGKADLIWYNAATGETAAWLMNGTTASAWTPLLTDANWKVIAAADFNGDGKADLLWYNELSGQTAAWIMNGGTQKSGATLVADPNWRVAATADFNGDGKADILWNNASTGQFAVWLMNGTAIASTSTLTTDPNWRVAATADFNGDGKSDLAWFNQANGNTLVWLMNGSSVLSSASLMTDANWRITATADLNGDGKADLLWYNGATGQTSVWLMNGTTGTAGANLFTDPRWRLKCIKSPSWTSLLACDDSEFKPANSAMTPATANRVPIVNAGPDQDVTLPAAANLSGGATDDSYPIGLLTSSWKQISGPGAVIFGNAAALRTSATFSAPGTYTLRLTATDSALSASDDVVIVVNAPGGSGSNPSNHAPAVNAGPDQSITLPSVANLLGTASDDGLPSGSTLTTSWVKISGPGAVIFGSANAFATTAFFSGPGTYTLRLTASDGALSTIDDVVVVVSPSTISNKAPVVSAGLDQMIAFPATASLSGSASDDGLPTGSVLTVSWSKVSGPGAVTFANAASLNTTASFSVSGAYTLRLAASDSVLSTTADVVVVVSAPPPANLAPVVNAGPGQTITFPAGASLHGTASDDGLPNGSSLTVSWSKVSGPGTVVFVNANSLTASATFLSTGTYTLRLTATDGLLSTTSDVVIVVNPEISSAAANLAPVVNAGADQTITMPSSASLTGTGTDDGLPTGSTLTTSWSKVSGPGTVTFSSGSSLNATATFSTAGTYTLRLTASDGALSANDDIVVTVNAAPPVNQAPVVNAGADQTITLPSTASLAGTGTDDGLPAGSTLTRSWSKVSGPGTVTFGSGSSLNTTATFSTAGTYTLRLTASDGALSATDDVVITVSSAQPGNQAPVVNAGTDQAITLPSAAALSGSASDDGLPTGSTLTISWIKVSGPGTVTFGSGSTLNTIVAFSTAGTYTLRLTASDGALLATDDIIVTVNAAPANQAPVVYAGADQTITLPVSAILVGSATDDGLPFGGTLTRTWSKVSGPGTVTFGAGSSLSTGATFSSAGTYTLRLTVNDSALSATDDVIVTVNPAPALNHAPAVSAGPDQTVALPASAILAGSATDDGLPAGTLTISWSKVSGPGSVIFVNSASLNATATFLTPGTYTLRLTVTDGSLSTSDDVVILVNPCGTVVSGTVTVLANASDNVGVAGVQFKLDGTNLGPNLTISPYSVLWNTLTASNGCHELSVTALDAAGNAGSATFLTTVSNP